MRSEEGFTLIEMVVTALALGLIMIAALSLYGEMGQVAINSDNIARTQSDVRVAIDELEKNLRAAGNDIDYSRGQERIGYADPYQVIFNSDLMPLIDDDGTGLPAALRLSSGGFAVPGNGSPLYVPLANYATGAETVMFTIDSNRDGQITAADKGDDPEEDSDNPNDYMLYRMVFGWDGSANSVEMEKVALIRGPDADFDGNLVPPLFSYFIDQDDDLNTPPVLHGDSDGDGVITGSEGAAAGPLSRAERSRVERIALNVIGETTRPDGGYHQNGGYRRVALTGEVQLRQKPRTTAIIYGVVYNDVNQNGLYDLSEQPLAGVVIQSTSGVETQTRDDGSFRLAVGPGQQIITEIDPSGYTSSTAGSVTLDVYPGAFMNVNFGDYNSTGSGTVSGVVFDDVDRDGTWNPNTERGLPNIKVYSDTGEFAYTADSGAYSLTVPVGIRSITEVDDTGYFSTTPNSVELEISNGGSASAFFGDAVADSAGTVEGVVYLDENGNQVRDSGETGVPGAQIVVAGQTTNSDTQGFFSLTVPAGTYAVTEIDPPGYSSTTPNTVNGVRVDMDQVAHVEFGDKVLEDVNFDIIELANTERALSLAAGDLKEDNRGDEDLVLGTRFTGGSNNLLVWHNERINSRTPNSAIFNSTPSFTRPNVADVLTLEMNDVDGDGDKDVVAGLAASTYGHTLNVWLAELGIFSDTPDRAYSTLRNGTVFDIATISLDGNTLKDFVAGVSNADYEGHLEFWWNRGSGDFSSSTGDALMYTAAPLPNLLGSVTAVATGDVNRDGLADVVVASHEEMQKSTVNVYVQSALGGLYLPWQSFVVVGKVTDVALVDMAEDGDGDLDIVVAKQIYETRGGIELWSQHEDGRFGIAVNELRAMDDEMPTSGAPLSMLVQYVDNDVFPDLIIGTRTTSPYGGDVQLARTFGYLPREPETLNETILGTVVTMTNGDFNQDNRNDFAIGTQDGNSTGKVIIFFRQ